MGLLVQRFRRYVSFEGNTKRFDAPPNLFIQPIKKSVHSLAARASVGLSCRLLWMGKFVFILHYLRGTGLLHRLKFDLKLCDCIALVTTAVSPQWLMLKSVFGSYSRVEGGKN